MIKWLIKCKDVSVKIVSNVHNYIYCINTVYYKCEVMIKIMIIILMTLVTAKQSSLYLHLKHYLGQTSCFSCSRCTWYVQTSWLSLWQMILQKTSDFSDLFLTTQQVVRVWRMKNFSHCGVLMAWKHDNSNYILFQMANDYYLLGLLIQDSFVSLLNNLIYYSIGHVRYINILAWLQGFRVKIANFSSFFCLSIPKRDLDTKKTTPNIDVWPESLGAMLEYWYIERSLFWQPNEGVIINH